jgi:hypothetical protein
VGHRAAKRGHERLTAVPAARLRRLTVQGPATDPPSAEGDHLVLEPLHRLEERDWVDAKWERSDTGRRTRVYRLTTKGRQQLRAETGDWLQFVEAMGKVLSAQGQPA